jgi:hypothetical protein
MKIYQRMLYVGLGGTGLKIGMQLEQRLRAELCGADGEALTRRAEFSHLQPYELPAFLQFVYADYDEGAMQEAMRASERLTKSPGAARNTSVYISNMTPPANSYARVAESLRTNAPDAVREWLPAKDNEPQVAPLSIGAGQFPTVGRAALFEAFRAARGISAIEEPLQTAVSRLARSRGDLQALLGYTPRDGCDVFVGFSVAGGTGAGIFYDFLRIVSASVQKNLGDASATSDVRIYPLVVLPSAFDAGQGGGRAADLNGGPALRELFGMINNANTGKENPPIAYPGEQTLSIGTHVPAQTAFLFRRPQAITIEDLHRSMVAFIISLVGTELKQETGTRESSFASWFVNQSHIRGEVAPDGIGRRPASTALAAQLTIPLAEISEILSRRLVAEATRQLNEAPKNENNRDLVEQFVAASGLMPLQQRQFDDALPGVVAEEKGAKEIVAELSRIRQAAGGSALQLRRDLNTRVATLANGFNWGLGIRDTAAKFDLFRVGRVALGDQRLGEIISQEGFVGVLSRRATPFNSPDGTSFKSEPPQPPPLANTVLGMRKVKWSDVTPSAALTDLTAWYVWRTKAAWNEAWSANSDTWRPKVRQLQTKVRGVVGAFTTHAANEQNDFQSSCQNLYQPRTGVVYFLPPDRNASNDLSGFYQGSVLPKLRDRLSLPEGADAGQVLNRIMGQRWNEAYDATTTGGEGAALQYVLDVVDEAVYEVLDREDENPILPRLKTLLAAVAAERDDTGFPPGLAERFKTALASLLPAGFAPGGTTPLSTQVFYPADGQNPVVEDFLKRTLFADKAEPEFHQLADANFLGIVLTRSELAATDVEEFRRLMQVWGDALDNPRAGDKLAWRQRLGYDARWIALSLDDRTRITLSFLNALWDGSVEVLAGTPESPERIKISQHNAPGAPPIELELKPWGKLSRWSSLLRAYERYTLSDDKTAEDRAAQLIARDVPTGITDDPGMPAPLYTTLIELIPEQQALARQAFDQIAEAARGQAMQVLEFWMETIPEALAHEFTGGGGPMGRNHVELYARTRS